MFYNLHTIWQLALWLIGLAVFTFISWRRPRLAAWLVIFLAPLYLLKINSWPLTVLESLIWVFVTAWLAQKIKNRQQNWRQEVFGQHSRGFWLSLALVLAGLFLSAFFSSDWRISFGVVKAYFIAPIIFSFVLATVFKESRDCQPVFSAVFAASAAVAALAAAYLSLGRLTFDGRVAAFYLSPNHLAMWLVPGLIAGFGLWLYAKKDWQKVLLSLVACLLLFVLYSTYSWGAWLGLIAAGIFILAFLWQSKSISRRQLFFIFCFLFLVLASIIFMQLNGRGNEKLASLLTSTRSSWQSRLMIWQSAILILRDHWLLGVGPGLFQPHYLEYQKYFSAPYLEWAVPQPHNLFLAWWLQTGLLGLSGFLGLLIIFFRQGAEWLKKIPSWPIIILTATMVSILIHGLADTPVWKNDLALIWWLIIFLGCRAGRRVY